MYPFSEVTEAFVRLTEVVKVVLGCYTPHLCTCVKVVAGRNPPATSQTAFGPPHTWLCWPWAVSATQCTTRPYKTPESQSCFSSYHPKTHLPSPQWILFTWIPHTERASSTSQLLAPDKTHLLPWTLHLSPQYCNTSSAFTLSPLPNSQQEK